MTLAVEVTPDYEDLGLLGTGGMGEVRRVLDRRLGRVMAMKILRADLLGNPAAVARFVEEAQATAQLQHPGIVPVHDIGRLPDGRTWFTMREVQGRTLADVIREVHDASPGDRWEAGPSGWTFRRLVDAFRAVCEAVGYAHARAVVHRDLKPQNVMVGPFGEVLVLDWGLAMVRGGAGESVVTVRSGDDALETRMGTVAGTPAYMPPEQARGQIDRIGPATDVYALGAILYEILAGRPPYEGADGRAVLRAVLTGPPAPPQRARPGSATFGFEDTWHLPSGPPLPEDLVAACLCAMDREPEARFADAGLLAAEVASWADGARRRDRALALVAEAEAARPAALALVARAQALREDARSRLEATPPWAPVEDKAPAWAMEDEAAALEERADIEEARFLVRVHGALAEEPDLPEGHALLALHYRDRMQRAETLREGGARRYELLVRAHDRGQHAPWLEGVGAITLATDVPAAVALYRYREIGRRLVAEPAGNLGTTPLVRAPLAMGSWLLVLHAPGREAVRYPVRIDRQAHWEGGTVSLPLQGSLSPDEVYVPAGWFARGGDPLASGSPPASRVWVDAFVVRRFAATNAEYLAFLATCSAAEAERCAPAEWQRVGDSIRSPANLRPDLPVVGIDRDAAEAFARAAGGRLLRADEWEKAARGVDARIFPWGNTFDATFCRMRESAAEARICEVDSHPVDESPYGVRGLAGNACTWCADTHAGRGVYRGGAWAFHATSVRSACSYVAARGYRYYGLGVRIARDP
jgi:serine/threonine-protein kinase